METPSSQTSEEQPQIQTDLNSVQHNSLPLSTRGSGLSALLAMQVFGNQAFIKMARY